MLTLIRPRVYALIWWVHLGMAHRQIAFGGYVLDVSAAQHEAYYAPPRDSWCDEKKRLGHEWFMQHMLEQLAEGKTLEEIYEEAALHQSNRVWTEAECREWVLEHRFFKLANEGNRRARGLPPGGDGDDHPPDDDAPPPAPPPSPRHAPRPPPADALDRDDLRRVNEFRAEVGMPPVRDAPAPAPPAHVDRPPYSGLVLSEDHREWLANHYPWQLRLYGREPPYHRDYPRAEMKRAEYPPPLPATWPEFVRRQPLGMSASRILARYFDYTQDVARRELHDHDSENPRAQRFPYAPSTLWHAEYPDFIRPRRVWSNIGIDPQGYHPDVPRRAPGEAEYRAAWAHGADYEYPPWSDRMVSSEERSVADLMLFDSVRRLSGTRLPADLLRAKARKFLTLLRDRRDPKLIRRKLDDMRAHGAPADAVSRVETSLVLNEALARLHGAGYGFSVDSILPLFKLISDS